MRRTFLAGLIVLGFTLSAFGSTITLCNTGDAACTTSPNPTGTADVNFVFTATGNPNSPGSTTAFAWDTNNVFPIPPWLAPDAASSWIAPVATQGTTVAAGTYDYREVFVTPGAGSVSITGQFASDNGALINLDGATVGSSSTSFSSFTPFTITTTVTGSTHNLDFLVTNAPGTSGNPSGLRVEFSNATFTAAAPEPSTFIMLLAAGLTGLVFVRRRMIP